MATLAWLCGPGPSGDPPSWLLPGQGKGRDVGPHRV